MSVCQVVANFHNYYRIGKMCKEAVVACVGLEGQREATEMLG